MRSDIFTLESNLPWLNGIAEKIETIFLGQLYNDGVFNEVYVRYTRRFFRRKKVNTVHVGVWGWNSWCGIHTFPVLTGGEIAEIVKRTIDIGFDRPEAVTGLLPHAIVHKDGVFCSEHTYKCYAGGHGEAYNLDNILCWAKMAMEYFLATGDGGSMGSKGWFTAKKMERIHTTVDYILANFRGKFHPHLIYAGIEGDWTECTNWEMDNSNVNVNLLETLRLAIASEKLLKQLDPQYSSSTPNNYQTIFTEILSALNTPITKGGFWYPEAGFYIHGNNGNGTIMHGNRYFEATVNYFAILWNFASPEYAKKIFEFISHSRKPIEMPYPVLTNFYPRTGARRTHYGRTVTNGDIWMVLGGHAAAARLQMGNIAEGTEMYQAIINYEQKEGVLHNCIYQDGTVNDAWDPEIANYGALYAPLVLGLLGIRLQAEGMEFHITGLTGLTDFKVTLFIFGRKMELAVHWENGSMKSGALKDLTSGTESSLNTPTFLISRQETLKVVLL